MAEAVVPVADPFGTIAVGREPAEEVWTYFRRRRRTTPAGRPVRWPPAPRRSRRPDRPRSSCSCRWATTATAARRDVAFERGEDPPLQLLADQLSHVRTQPVAEPDVASPGSTMAADARSISITSLWKFFRLRSWAGMTQVFSARGTHRRLDRRQEPAAVFQAFGQDQRRQPASPCTVDPWYRERLPLRENSRYSSSVGSGIGVAAVPPPWRPRRGTREPWPAFPSRAVRHGPPYAHGLLRQHRPIPQSARPRTARQRQRAVKQRPTAGRRQVASSAGSPGRVRGIHPAKVVAMEFTL